MFGEHIVEQAQFEPAILAAGWQSLPLLRMKTRRLEDSLGVSASALLDGIEQGVDAAFVVADLSENHKARVDAILAALRRAGASRITIILTGETTTDVVHRYDDCQCLDLRSRRLGDEENAARMLALLLHSAGAKSIFVIGAGLGIAALGWYGAALQKYHRIYAALDVPLDGLFKNIHHLRLVARSALLLAFTPQERDILRHHATPLGGPGVALIAQDCEIFDHAFTDLRSQSSRDVTDRLMGARSVASPTAHAASPDHAFDVTVAVLFHAERDLAGPALSSLRRMIEVARADGISVEALLCLDRADDATRQLVMTLSVGIGEVCEYDFGSPAPVRNAAVAKAKGQFIALLDGDDLWCSDWLSLGYRSAQASPDIIWHPEALFLFVASDCDRASGSESYGGGSRSWLCIQESSDVPWVDQRDLLFENAWSANAIAHRNIYLSFPYHSDNWASRIGIEDWRWNLDTLGHGIHHRVVTNTMHMIRIKEDGSFGQLHEAARLMPILE